MLFFTETERGKNLITHALDIPDVLISIVDDILTKIAFRPFVVMICPSWDFTPYFSHNVMDSTSIVIRFQFWNKQSNAVNKYLSKRTIWNAIYLREINN